MTALPDPVDLCVVAAGPAGLAAAVEARVHGLSVVLLDEQPAPGGQIYRTIETAPARRAALLGDDYRHGADLAARFRDSGASYRPGAGVWQIAADGQVAFTQDGRAGFLSARRVVVAVGAQERPVPVPGWTLPGVMAAGAGQILLKTSGLVPLHQGVVPNVQLTQALGCAHDWDGEQLCWRPRLDQWGNTDLPGIAVAGDGGGIGGALAAEQAGHLAALEAAHRLDRIDAAARDRAAAAPSALLRGERRARPFLERLYRPPAIFRRPADETLVCRCEEVTAGELRAAAALGCRGPNQAKAFTRCGMGPCQGRFCGLTVSEIIAEAHDLPGAAVGPYRQRSPVKPVTLGELAQAELEGEASADCDP